MNIPLVQSMIKAIDKPAIFIDLNYSILAVNQAYRDTYSQVVQTGKSKCYEVSHGQSVPCDQAGEECPLQQCKTTGKVSSVVHIHQLPKGKSYCDIVMRPVVDDDGMTIGYIKILDKVEFASHQASPNVDPNTMIGHSPAFKQLINQINRVAPTQANTLLLGETGTGKELVAQAIHQYSQTKDKPMVIIECTGITDNLFESELFGHEKGAFTGATSAKKGLVDLADGGTLFFDEIGDVPLNIQVKLLRLIETGTYRSVGGVKQKHAKFRLICATHKQLPEMVQAQTFRADLYYRIATFPIQLPQLQSRAEDIPELARLFLQQIGFKHKSFTTAAMAQLIQYSFPGNIRELKNMVEYAAIMSHDLLIDTEHLPLSMKSTGADLDNTEQPVIPLAQLEPNYLANVIAQYPGNMKQLAHDLQISERTLYRKCSQYELKLEN
ncbi:MAG: sigma 54-interacting transcriptional regulator [Glaciecola sp.]|nr:sigma 54-interacting transcriptional regulator [Glaciecola sp.]